MRTADVCPTCSTFINALCVIYDGPYLITMDVSQGDDMQLVIQQIEAYLATIDPQVSTPNLQQVTDSGNVTTNSMESASLLFTSTAAVAVVTGELAWNDAEKTLDLGLLNGNVLPVGQKMIYHVTNSSGISIPGGIPVTATGTVGASGKMIVAASDVSTVGTSKFFLGLAMESIANGDDGYIVSFGKVDGIDTTGALVGEVWAEEEILWVNNTISGQLTNVKPTKGIKLPVAFIITSHAVNGVLAVRATVGTNIAEANDLDLTTLNTADTIVWDANLNTFITTPLLSGEQFPVENEYADIATLLADQGNQTEKYFQYVTDASADPNVISGEAYYAKLAGSTTTLADDYNLLSDTQIEILIGNNPFKSYTVSAVNDDAVPLTSVSNKYIGIDYSLGSGFITSVILNSPLTKKLNSYIALDTKPYIVLERVNKGSGNRIPLKVSSFTVVGDYIRANIVPEIDATNFGVNDKVYLFFDESSDTSGFVPYIGATADVDLGLFDISATLFNNTDLGKATVGTDNYYFGDLALGSNTGSRNTAIGRRALELNTANDCVGVGGDALRNNTGNSSTAVGVNSLENNTGFFSTAVGYNAGLNNIGTEVTFMGWGSGTSNSGGEVIGIGYNTLQFNGGENVFAIGADAGLRNLGNLSNLLGDSTGTHNSGDYASLIGDKTGFENNGNNVEAIGRNSCYYNDGFDVVAIGRDSNATFKANTTGDKTFAFGDIDIALDRITVTAHGFGANNDFVNLLYTEGTSAIGGMVSTLKYNVKIIDVNTLEFRTVVGNGGTRGVDIISVGTGTGHTLTPNYKYNNIIVLGANAEPTTSNQVVLGDSSVTEVVMGNGEVLNNIKKVKISLTATNVNNIGTTPITAIAAPGAGKVINVISTFANLTYGATAFDNNTLNLETSGAGGTLFTFSSFLDSIANTLKTADRTVASDNDLIVNTAVVISGIDSVATGDSTVDIYITYEIITL